MSGLITATAKTNPAAVTTAATINTAFTPFFINVVFVGSDAVHAL